MIPKPGKHDFVYFDWDKNKVTTLPNKATESVEYPTLRHLVERLKKPTVLIGESTFESYNLHERKAVFDLAMARGHKWYGTPNRATYRWRNRFGWDKSDANDVQFLRLLTEYPGSLNSIRPYKTGGRYEQGGHKKAHKQDPWIYDYLPMVDVSKYIGKGNWTRLKRIDVMDPDEFKQHEWERREVFRSRQMEAMEFRRLDDTAKKPRYTAFQQAVLDSLGVTYKPNSAATARAFTAQFPLINNSAMWAVAHAARASKNRQEFESLLGLHAHGAKSMLRSQIYHWGWAGQGKGPMTKGARLTDYRRQVRQLGSIVAENEIDI